MKIVKDLVGILLAAACLAVCGPATARTIGGVTFADTVNVDGQTLVLNGIGKRKFVLIVDGYASALYLPTQAHTAAAVLAEQGPKLLYTEFLHAASVDQIRSEFTDVYKSYCSDHTCSAASHETFNRVLATVQPVKVGDTATYLINDGTLSISENGKPVLTVHDPEYTHGMLDSLLGEASPTAAYRRGLLGTT